MKASRNWVRPSTRTGWPGVRHDASPGSKRTQEFGMQHRLAAGPRTDGSLSVMTLAPTRIVISVNGEVSWPRTHGAAAARMIGRRGCDARAADIREAPQTPVNVRSAA
jgi:hypothetical protein